ncbi:retrovirus-related pol polyprotein from transposon TNT 1-94 [Tanacetum coccineum]
MPQTHFPIKLTSSNFPVWRKQIQSTLIGLDLLQYIVGTLAIPSQFSDNERKTIMSQLHSLGNRQDQTLLSAIRGSCSDMIQPIISSASSSKEAWERLLHSYENASRSRIISLKSKLAKNPKGNKSVAEFLNENVDIPRTYADYEGPDEIFLGDGNSHPISHTGNNTKFLDEFVNNLSIKFSIKDLGTSHQFLGVEVISTPSRSIVGSLQYLAITRPDVSFAVNKLSQFMHAPTQLHLQALKRVLRYLKGTIHHGLFLNRKSAITLTAFSDSNWGGIKDNGRSTTAYILYLGSNIISLGDQPDRICLRFIYRSEYKALAKYSSAEMMWVQNLLHELGISLHETPTLFCDNTGATYLCANPVYHSCMKHVAHFVREWVSEGSLRVLHISSKDQLVDMLTKPLGRS